MRYKIPKDEKKIPITFTINPELEKLLKQYIKELGISKSKFIESLLKDKLTKNNNLLNVS